MIMEDIMKTNNKKDYPVLIEYLKGSLNDKDLYDLEGILNKANLSLIKRECPSVYLNGIEELFPAIKVILSHEITQVIVLGLATNFIYDALKNFVLNLYKKLKNKKLFKITNKKINELDSTIYIVVGKVTIILPSDLDDDKFKYCINKIVDTFTTESIEVETYWKYDYEYQIFRCYSKEKLMEKYYDESKNK